jgi:hypothetical protein
MADELNNRCITPSARGYVRHASRWLWHPHRRQTLCLGSQSTGIEIDISGIDAVKENRVLAD